ncbi:MAG TPA: hypothetical protein VKO18_00585 [Terriglobia bacterium]|nr:hypothetical protein [Terriglobia bacterium]
MSPQQKLWFRLTSAREAKAATTGSGSEPSRVEVLLMLAMMLALHLFTVCRAGSFWELAVSRTDDMDYVEVADIIRHWHFAGGPISQYFWGFPYAIAGVSTLLSIPELMAAVVISVFASLALCTLLCRLYGGWVTAVFLLINFEWIQLSVEGGSEPLFMCLLFASFLVARSGRWNLAALLASLSTTVRPVGVFALACFAIVLARQKNYRQLAVIMLMGLAIGVLYVIPLWRLFGTPFANFIGYRGDWGPHGWPLTYPFGALISSFLASLHKARWYTLTLFAAWPLVALVSTVAIWLPRNRQGFLARYQPEALFASIYTLFYLSYNNGEIVWLFSRFLIPVLPLLVFSLRDWIPHHRRLLWAAAVLSALLSSAGLVHFKNVFGFSPP